MKLLMKSTFSVLIVFGIALSMAKNTQAQSTATALATLTVAESITITSTDLAFPGVMQGTTTTTAPADGTNGGVFTLSGAANEDVEVEFTVLPLLSDAGGAGGTDITVSWVGDASVDGGTTLLGVDPAAGPQTVTLNGSGGAEVYIGGTASPDAAQTPSSYEGTVELTASYLNI
jgi:hypothetical protein